MSATHQSQYQPGASVVTRHAGCTWTSVANGVGTITAGAHQPTPDQVHDEVAHTEETSPATPGWSIPDAVLASHRLGYELVDHTDEGFAALVGELETRHYVLAQGDSDQFGNATCSGAFDGPHCIGIDGSKSKLEDGERWWWIDDPICPTGRWERESVLKRYTQKLRAGVRFAVFAIAVPKPVPPKPKPVVTLRYGAKALPRRTVKVFVVADANVFARPDPSSKVVNVRHRGGRWPAWQAVTNKEGHWFGSKNGTRWIRRAAVR